MTGTAGLFPETVHVTAGGLAAEAFGSRVQMVVAGVRATVTYRLSAAEHERRVEAGLGEVTSPDLLRVLLTLPLGERVRLPALPDADRRLLRAAVPGVVTREGTEVLRLAVPPVEAGIALVAVRSWRHGLELAGMFTPFCARAMVLARTPRELDDLQMEADFYGIGVIVMDGPDERPSLIVPATPFVRERFTVGGWLFLEQLYQSIR